MGSAPPRRMSPREALIRFILATLIMIPLIGLLAAFVAQYIYILLVFPLLLAATSGMLVGSGLYTLNVQNRLVPITLATIYGAAMYGVYWLGKYLFFAAKVPNVTDLDFLTYLRLTAKIGVTIAEVGTSDPGITLSEPLTWLYWMLELLLICGAAIFISFRVREYFNNYFAKLNKPTSP